jgi:nucleotide-binding universal stress UspA family protein
MFRRILVPVDATRDGRRVARFAARLARAMRARLHACYVIDRDLVHSRHTIAHLREPLRQELEREGRRALAQAGRVCKTLRVPFEATLAEGRVAAEVVAVARRRKVDLIVLGTAGLGPLRRLVLGSHSQAIVGDAPCPVLLLRRKA